MFSQTRVQNSVHVGHTWQGGVHSRPGYVARGMHGGGCMAGGCVWQVGMHGGGCAWEGWGRAWQERRPL